MRSLTSIGETQRDLVRRLGEDPDWIRRMATEITTAIHAELPELGADEEIAEGTLASTASVLRLFTEMVERGLDPSEAQPPPAAVEYARELMRRGLSFDNLLRSYYVGHAIFYERWVESIHASTEDPVEVARSVEQIAVWAFAYVQSLSRGLLERYSEERERWVRNAAAIRAETVRALLAGEDLDHTDVASRLGFSLDRQHLALAVWRGEVAGGDGVDFGDLESTASALADALGATATLLVPFGPGMVAGWIGGSDQRFDERSLRDTGLPGAVRTGTLAALGSPAPGIEGFRRSHRQAMHARRVAMLSGRRSATVTHYRDVALTALATADLDHAREFARNELGALAGDDDTSVRLAATVRIFLEEQSSPRRSARRLGVHENTITNRVRAAEELLGHPLNARVTELLAALRLAPLIREPTPMKPNHTT